MPDLSEYELQRREKIAKNQALLRQLQLDAATAGMAPSSTRPKPAPSHNQTKKRAATRSSPQARIKSEEAAAPRRTSSRLRGIQADSELAKRKADEEAEAVREAQKVKRQRVGGDLALSDVLVAGVGLPTEWNRSGNWLSRFGPADPGVRTFDEEDVRETTDTELRETRERLAKLSLWKDVEPGHIKITPERIYSLGFHPVEDKALVFAGDKLGNLGLFDSSQELTKAEPASDDDEADDRVPDVAISSFKIHTRTISAFEFSQHDANHLYSASYDSTIRRLDLTAGVATQVYAPVDDDVDEPLSGVQVVSENDSSAAPIVYFTTLDGQFGIQDARLPPTKPAVRLFNLSEKKIGGFSLNPRRPHVVATASLDRTLKIWDLRALRTSGGRAAVESLPALMGSHESRLSVSHAAFNAAGQVATASYDDTVKIYDCGDWGAGEFDASAAEGERELKPSVVVPHNNQTGRWVTILRAQWQARPRDGMHRFVIGNMNRFVDVYSATGEQLAQLGGDGITAVPAVAQFHPSMEWIAAGTASGKLCLWM